MTTLGVHEGALFCDAPLAHGESRLVGMLAPLPSPPAPPPDELLGVSAGVANGVAANTFSRFSPVLFAALLILLADTLCVYLTARYGPRSGFRKPMQRSAHVAAASRPAASGLVPDERIPPMRSGAGATAGASDRVINTPNWTALMPAQEEARRNTAVADSGNLQASDASPAVAPAGELIQERIARPIRPTRKAVAGAPRAAVAASVGSPLDALAWPPAAFAAAPALDDSKLIPQERIGLRRPLGGGARSRACRGALPELNATQRSSAERDNLEETLTVQERIPLPPLRPRARAGRLPSCELPPANVSTDAADAWATPIIERGSSDAPPLRRVESTALLEPTPAPKRLPTLEKRLSERSLDSASSEEALKRLRVKMASLNAICEPTASSDASSLAMPELLPQERLRAPRRARAARTSSATDGPATNGLSVEDTASASSPPPSPPHSPTESRPLSSRARVSDSSSLLPGLSLALPPPSSTSTNVGTLAWPNEPGNSPARSRPPSSRARVSDSSSPLPAKQPVRPKESPLRRAAVAVSAAADASNRPLPLSSAVRVLPRPSAAQARATATAGIASSWATLGQTGSAEAPTTTVAMPRPPGLPRVVALALRHHTLTGLVFALLCAAPTRRGISSPMRCHVFWTAVAAQLLSATMSLTLGAQLSFVLDDVYLALPNMLHTVVGAIVGTATGVVCAGCFRLARWVNAGSIFSWASAWFFNVCVLLVALVAAVVTAARVDWSAEGPAHVLIITWLISSVVQWLLAEPLFMLAVYVGNRYCLGRLPGCVRVLPPDPYGAAAAAREHARAARPVIRRVTRPPRPGPPALTVAAVTPRT